MVVNQMIEESADSFLSMLSEQMERNRRFCVVLGVRGFRLCVLGRTEQLTIL
jgi:hypothetical protein